MFGAKNISVRCGRAMSLVGASCGTSRRRLSSKPAAGTFLSMRLIVGLTALAWCIPFTGCAFKVMTGPSSVELDILPCAPSVSVSLAGAAVASPACPMERTSLTFGTSLKNEPESLK